MQYGLEQCWSKVDIKMETYKKSVAQMNRNTEGRTCGGIDQKKQNKK